jgi:hypothetical protein
MHPSWIQTGTWDYHDEHGNYAYSVVRFDWRGAPHLLPSTMRPKDYRPGRRFAAGERLYRWGLPAEARVPYRLPFVLGALERRALLWICEGEKACEALVNAAPDETATTMPGGSNSWAVGAPERWLPPETRASVIVDRDEAGRGWAADVQKTLPRASFWQSATLGEGDDVVDHLAAGFGLDELVPMPEGG